jgi:hypothetical protein
MVKQKYKTKELIECLVSKILFCIDWLELWICNLFVRSYVKKALNIREFWIQKDEEGHKVPKNIAGVCFDDAQFSLFLMKCMFAQYGWKRITSCKDEFEG